MVTTIRKWGNSLAIRLPAAVVEALGLKPGDDVDVSVGRAEVRIDTRENREALLERLRKYRGTMPADYKFDRDEANAR